MNQLLTRLFIEQPLASHGSANKLGMCASSSATYITLYCGIVKSIVPIYWILQLFAKGFDSNTESVLWREEVYTMKYTLSLREIPRAKPEGFPEGLGYIPSYFQTRVTIQTFLITTSALTFLGDQYWKSWFFVLLRQLDNTKKYFLVDWAIMKNWS